MKKEIIIIIDPQKDFTHQNGNYAKKHTNISQIEAVKHNIQKLIDTTAPEKIIVVFSNYKEHQFGENIAMCIKDSWGHELDIKITPSHQLIAKTKHSCFSSPVFISFLRNHKIEHIILCGFLAEYCVSATAQEGLEYGYRVSLLKDCIGTGDDVQKRKNELFVALELKGAELIEVAHFINRN